MAESEELKSLLIKVKEESEKVVLKLNIQKTKIMASSPITSWQIKGETVERVSDFYFAGLQNHCRSWLQYEIKKMLTPWKKSYDQPSSVQFIHSVMSNSSWPHELQHAKASLSITNSRTLPKLVSIESWMPSNHLIFCHPLLLVPSIFPASGSFQMSQLFASGGQSIGVSASTSVLPMNTQD